MSNKFFSISNMGVGSVKSYEIYEKYEKYENRKLLHSKVLLSSKKTINANKKSIVENYLFVLPYFFVNIVLHNILLKILKKYCLSCFLYKDCISSLNVCIKRLYNMTKWHKIIKHWIYLIKHGKNCILWKRRFDANEFNIIINTAGWQQSCRNCGSSYHGILMSIVLTQFIVIENLLIKSSSSVKKNFDQLINVSAIEKIKSSKKHNMSKTLNSLQIKEIIKKTWRNSFIIEEIQLLGHRVLLPLEKNVKLILTDHSNFFTIVFLNKVVSNATYKNSYSYNAFHSEKYNNILLTKLNELNIIPQQRNEMCPNNNYPINQYSKLLWIINELKKQINFNSKQSRFKSLKSVFDKKEGLVRSNMMAKRVDFSSRSVASPDPYILSSDLGIPKNISDSIFITDFITVYNSIYYRIYNRILRGSLKNIGFTVLKIYVKEITFISNIVLKLTKMSRINQYLINSINVFYSFFSPIPVSRYLMNGDRLLVNRQPTLHKLGVLSHKIKVITKSLTFRINYINCMSYNVDFDGDEINVHIIRGLKSKSEAEILMNSIYQLKVPKDGSILRQLIQDNIVSIYEITSKVVFVELNDLLNLIKSNSSITSLVLNGVPSIIDCRNNKYYWTGVSFLSLIINSLSTRVKYLTFAKLKQKEKSGFDIINNENGSTICYKGYIIKGYIDKKEYSRNGFFDKLYNFIGSTRFAAFSEFLANFLLAYMELEGLSIGPNDMNTNTSKEKFYAKVKNEISTNLKKIKHRSNENFMSYHLEIKYKLIDNYDIALAVDCGNKIEGLKRFFIDKIFNMHYKELTKNLIIKNSLYNMVHSGGKGSFINIRLIKFWMGKIIFDDKNFLYEAQKKLNMYVEFIDHCYWTGLNFEEFFLHSLSGRERLLDITLKTHISGYLQRCIVKSTENLVSKKDFTVRDIASNEIVEFFYGLDGYSFDTNNSTIRLIKDFNTNLVEFDMITSNKIKEKLFSINNYLKDNIIANYPKINDYKNNSTIFHRLYLKKLESLATMWNSIATSWMKIFKRGEYNTSNSLVNIRNLIFHNIKYSFIFLNLKKQFIPGECLGIISGQSVCEPLTQMTLNSFHSTGFIEGGSTNSLIRLTEILEGLYYKKTSNGMLLPLKNKNFDDSIAYKLTSSFNSHYLRSLIREYFILKCNNIENSIFDLVLIFKKTYSSSKYMTINSDQLRRTIIQSFYYLLIIFYIKEHMLFFRTKLLKKFKKNSMYSRFYFDERVSYYYIHSKNCHLYYNYIKKKTVQLKYFFPTLIKNNTSRSSKKYKYYPRYYLIFIFNKSKGAIVDGIFNQFSMKSMMIHSKWFFQFSLSSTLPKTPSFEIKDFIDTLLNMKIYRVKKLRKAFSEISGHNKSISIQTQGTNLRLAFKYRRFISTSSMIFINYELLAIYLGIEAAYLKIYNDVINSLIDCKVELSKKHIKLISSYMTYKGIVTQLNRYGIKNTISFLYRMSFETNFEYFYRSISKCENENVNSFASCLITGKKIAFMDFS
uniref:DNA-directed RNA polymerase n=1 Tax=Amorphochlora amoebiformis TaxID=1561963 RepID=A0A0H5BLZ2_9EUKA|nr:largest subunit of RNA polymerase I [Amorphochlora amoebiformis]